MAASAMENLRSRKLPQDADGEVSFSASSNGVQLVEFTKLPASQPDGEEADDQTEGELTDLEVGDEKSLIEPEEGIDSDGVVREYEVALKHLGFGLFHILLLFINGMALLSDAIEILAISFVLPVLNRPEEYGVSDGEEALLSSVIFIGMLFGSYIWGSMADIVGRRTTLIASLTISAVFGFISAFSPWFWLFLVCRLFSGFGVGGSLPVTLPYAAEFIRNKYRGPYGSCSSIFWMFGRLLCGAFAWAIIPQDNINFLLSGYTFHSWRLFIAISALPSFIGAAMYFLLPESPRYLLEVGKQEKAMKALRLAYKINHFGRKVTYPVKSILLENTMSGLFLRGKQKKMEVFLLKCKEILRRTLELFKKRFIRITPPMLVIMFCISFGSYGITLWYPTYVGELTKAKDAADFERHCNANVTDDHIRSFCGCDSTTFIGFTVKDAVLHDFEINDVIFQDVTFRNVSFDSVIFNGTEFMDCEFIKCTFSRTLFNATYFRSSIVLDSLNLQTCPLNHSQVEARNFSTLYASGTFSSNESIHEAMLDTPLEMSSENCDMRASKISCSPPDYRVYRDSFFISASALPGNIASAFAVYFFPRNYWLAFVLFFSTVTTFLLFSTSSELFVVLFLCIFTAVLTPAWNDTSLITAEVYPTHLRSTATGIHLLMARVGAIIGSNLFGVFIRVNPGIPILFVASLLFLGSVTSLVLPKTTRKTLLK